MLLNQLVATAQEAGGHHHSTGPGSAVQEAAFPSAAGNKEAQLGQLPIPQAHLCRVGSQPSVMPEAAVSSSPEP